MEMRYTVDKVRYQRMTTEELRATFLVENLFRPGEVTLIYSEVDRAVIGGAVPTAQALGLPAGKEIASDYFCERREIGVMNIGATGTIKVDGKDYTLENRDALYIGRGSREVLLSSADAKNPAAFYLLSYPAHAQYPTVHARKADAEAVKLGSQESCNARTIRKYIHPDGIKSCQLVMGFTELEPGSIWNTMPCHTHERRSEIYLYFDLKSDALVFHLMGNPEETRHLVIRDREAAISPSWSIHSGCGTAAYTFIWGMGGENQVFNDMDAVEPSRLR